jgi:hypothetical protein
MPVFRGVVSGRAIVLLAAPLLVACTLLWQHHSRITPREQADAAANVAQDRRPLGVSPEEWAAARSEFDALTDSTFHCGVEEMPAYWRLLKWTMREPDFQCDQNQFSRVPFNDLLNRPSALRGMPVQVDLRVCRIVSYAAPENGLGIERLYEVWGWSDDSRGSLYVAVTPDLPPGMRTGESVSERATLYGYLYKIQGYVAAGSAPHALPSTAPLIIGRVARTKPPLTVIAKTSEIWPAGVGLILAASFVWLLSQRPPFRFRQRASLEQLAANATAKLESWIELEGRMQPHPACPDVACASQPSGS